MQQLWLGYLDHGLDDFVNRHWNDRHRNHRRHDGNQHWDHDDCWDDDHGNVGHVQLALLRVVGGLLS